MIKTFLIITAITSLANLYVFPDLTGQREWFDCNDRSVPAEKTRFDHYGVTIYRSLSGDLLFIVDKNKGKVKCCIPIGEDWSSESWTLSGFKEIKAGKYASEKVIAFEIQNLCVSRYFNIDNGKEIFVNINEDGELYVDYEQEIEEEPFEYPD